MTNRQQEWINKRAYALWEQSGGYHGQDQDHWEQASKEYSELIRTKATVDGSDVRSTWMSKAT